jgi:hypothetical protein
MTEADPDAIGPDGTLRLRRYLPLANSHWFSVAAAIRIMGSGDATVKQLA